MSTDCYATFCPIAKACDIIEPRWTMLIVSELLQGAQRFNEIRRGIPGISPTLLSRRLKELEGHGMLTRSENPLTAEIAYRPTAMAAEYGPILRAMGKWAHRNVNAAVTLEHLDARLLMWNLGRNVDLSALPPARLTVIQFSFPAEKPEDRTFWLVAKHGAAIDICWVDPGQDVDLFVQADLRAMTSVFMGYTSLHAEIARDRITLVGDSRLASGMSNWMVIAPYAAA
jgi:DNA-binding HxlR family transcriptional regulator